MCLERTEFHALDSSCAIFAVGVPRERLNDAVAWVAEMQARLTRFESESELSRLNASTGRWRPVSPTLEALLRESLAAYEASGGLVHAGVLPSLLAIGYTRTFSLGPTAPALEAVAPPPPLPEMLEVRAGQARLASGTGIDLGGIAKGWLADRLAADLGENALVNLGGDLRANGDGPEGEGWPVGFAGKTVLLRDQGVATSGTGRRRWGDALHHLIDPRTGAPARTDLSEVSVIAATASAAEVLAKTALLLGAASAEEFLRGRALGWSLH